MNKNQDTTKELESKSTTAKPQKNRSFRKFMLFLFSYIAVGLVVWQFAMQFNQDPAKQKARADAEIKKTIEKISDIMIIPKDETPQVAVIQEAANLAKTQDFFVDVKDGDQIILYTAAKKAIIYRPSENKIVNVGPIIPENTSEKTVAPASPKQTEGVSTTTTTAPTTSTTDAE